MKAKHLIDLLHQADPEKHVKFTFDCSACLTEFPLLEIIEDTLNAEGELIITFEDNSH